jgi:glycosyltransferase involved in cell wall biosynthesis
MTADTVGGVWSYAMELCASLAPLGIDVALATLGGTPSPAQQREVGRLRNVQLQASEYRLEWMQAPWESLAEAGEWLLALERQTAPDVIHLNHLVHGELAWRAPVIIVGHSCVYSWWEAVRGGAPDESWKQYRARVTQSLRCAQRVVAPSRAMLRALCRHYGPFQHTGVIPNARDPSRYRPDRKVSIILSAGRLWDEAKNVRVLCDVAPSLPWPVLVAGENVGPDGQTRPCDNVTSLGQLSPAAMAHWLGRVSIYVAPALYEPFGLGALEAGLSGCALVLSNLDSLQEIWEDAALYVTPGSAEDLREALLELIEHPRAIPILGERARMRAHRFHPRSFALSYRQLYRSVCEPKETASCVSYSSITH